MITQADDSRGSKAFSVLQGGPKLKYLHRKFAESSQSFRILLWFLLHDILRKFDTRKLLAELASVCLGVWLRAAGLFK